MSANEVRPSSTVVVTRVFLILGGIILVAVTGATLFFLYLVLSTFSEIGRVVGTDRLFPPQASTASDNGEKPPYREVPKGAHP